MTRQSPQSGFQVTDNKFFPRCGGGSDIKDLEAPFDFNPVLPEESGHQVCQQQLLTFFTPGSPKFHRRRAESGFTEYGELREFFGPHRVPGRELSEFLSAYYLCAKANSPSFSQNSPSFSQNSPSSHKTQ